MYVEYYENTKPIYTIFYIFERCNTTIHHQLCTRSVESEDILYQKYGLSEMLFHSFYEGNV